ncbi:MAG: DNA polymerase III subunit alpha, partial [Peptococcaceae bacterium]|nr:DNA polymerase III subunit alpha [Peptococcaceae bacterium]
KVAKMIPNELGMTIKGALESSQELRNICDEDEQVRELIATAQQLEGMPRHAGTHAAGVVISQESLDKYLPLQKSQECGVITQYAKENVEEIGLLKMDFLGLRTLTVINKAIDMVEANHGVRIDFDKVDLNDKLTYELLCRGDSIGVFQLESSGLRAIMRDLEPTSLEEVIALVALYRPGPLSGGMADDFIERKHGRKQNEYLHPVLKPILETTYGVILYQEQVMRIASDLAGFTLGEADMLRRAMGKKKPEIIAGLKQQFIDGAAKNNVEESIAIKVFELIEYFAGYGFNKSHSAAYAIVAFQTAYLKAHYPAEFMAALLSSVMDNNERVSFYIAECKRMNIPVLPPDVNESNESFIVVNGAIRFGLAALKNVGRAAVEEIMLIRGQEGPFVSLQDFCSRVNLHQMNKRMIENMIKGGAFNSLHANKHQLLLILDECISQGTTIQQQKNSAQISLFDLAEQSGLTYQFEPIKMPEVPDFNEQELLMMEKEVLGLYISGHPLDGYTAALQERTSAQIAQLGEENDQERVFLGGMINHFKITTTKRGETMATCEFEDLSGTIDLLVFPKVFIKYREFIQNDAIVLVKGRYSAQEDNPKLFVEHIESLQITETTFESEPTVPLAQLAEQKSKKFYLRLLGEITSIDKQREIQRLLMRYHGDIPVYFYFAEEKKMVLAEQRLWVKNDIDLLMSLTQLIGAENISIADNGKGREIT